MGFAQGAANDKTINMCGGLCCPHLDCMGRQDIFAKYLVVHMPAKNKCLCKATQRPSHLRLGTAFGSPSRLRSDYVRYM